MIDRSGPRESVMKERRLLRAAFLLCGQIPDYWMTCTTVRVWGSTRTVLSFTIV